MPVTTFAAIAYGTAGAGFLLLTLLLLTSWEGRAQGARLVLASGVTALWGAVLAFDAWAGGIDVAVVATSELLRDSAWLVLLTGLTERQGPWATLSRVALVAAGGLVLLAFTQLFGGLVPLHVPMIGLMVFGGLALSLLAMMLLEQIYRNANPAGRFATGPFGFDRGAIERVVPSPRVRGEGAKRRCRR